ncbi:CoxG family protein [Halorientalis marina]|jgi:carbon monoxide dehydrogenase subunit G|uniref:CoxG family protein n=1 Tax=Halorientalis marina TaxID=2931976 RepID=UPI001FF4968C|nr:SRPBCC family protein [Halorientalis marina]
MTVRVERTFELPAEPDRVWAFIADPEKRARPISVVDDFEQHDEHSATWFVKLPIPVINRHVKVETEDIEFEPPTHVKFVGKSKVMRVVGEHTLEAVDGGTRVTNSFVVDGKLPGVERFFKRNMDAELKNVENAMLEDLGLEAR